MDTALYMDTDIEIKMPMNICIYIDEKIWMRTRLNRMTHIKMRLKIRATTQSEIYEDKVSDSHQDNYAETDKKTFRNKENI